MVRKVRKPRAFVVGIDGGSPQLIDAWAAEGKLPAFARLMREGVFGPLESVPNMRSAAAWTSFMTGRNPGKHGVYEFYEYSPDLQRIRFLLGGDRDGATVWGLLSASGRKVGVINVPMTYPAEKVNGFLIAGLDAPGRKSRGFAHPPELLASLEERFGEYILEPGLTGHIVAGNTEAAVKALWEELDQKARISNYLSKEKEWDLFVTVFRSLDAVQHCFWKHMDPEHPFYDAEAAKKYGTVILEAYQRVDRYLGELLDQLDDDTSLFVVSDHGFGAKHPATSQLNRWLESEGFLAFRRQGRLVGLLAALYRTVVGRTFRGTKERLARYLPFLRNMVHYQLCFSQIDWEKTVAYTDTLYPTVWINRKPEGPLGGGGAKERYQEVVQKLRQRLAECRDSVTGEPVVWKVFEKSDIYNGPHADKAPDLLIRWREDLRIYGLAGVKDDPGEGTRIPGENPHVISGDHRVHGILFARGPSIRRAVRVADADLIDVAPTILHAMREPVPRDMDGRVLTELFEESFLRDHAVRISEAGGDTTDGRGESYSDRDMEIIADRLRGLGYLE
jgi:predicted AlkP superfamily phosphohydrolase/phosphomutase